MNFLAEMDIPLRLEAIGIHGGYWLSTSGDARYGLMVKQQEASMCHVTDGGGLPVI